MLVHHRYEENVSLFFWSLVLFSPFFLRSLGERSDTFSIIYIQFSDRPRLFGLEAASQTSTSATRPLTLEIFCKYCTFDFEWIPSSVKQKF